MIKISFSGKIKELCNVLTFLKLWFGENAKIAEISDSELLKVYSLILRKKPKDGDAFEQYVDYLNVMIEQTLKDIRTHFLQKYGKGEESI